MISPVSDKHFWSVLRNRIDTLLENQKGQVLVSGFEGILFGFVFLGFKGFEVLKFGVFVFL